MKPFRISEKQNAFIGAYRLPTQSHSYFFEKMNNALDMHSGTYDKLLIAVDFNTEETETVLEGFLNENDLKCIVKSKTCYKDP